MRSLIERRPKSALRILFYAKMQKRGCLSGLQKSGAQTGIFSHTAQCVSGGQGKLLHTNAASGIHSFDEQINPAGHLNPQTPQFWLSEVTSTQFPLQDFCPELQVADPAIWSDWAFPLLPVRSPELGCMP
jgi:hypothetical protein